LELFTGINFKGDFLKQKATRQLFAKEQYLPSAVIDRSSIRAWQQEGRLDTFARAMGRVNDLLAAYQQPAIPDKLKQALQQMVTDLAAQAGMPALPSLEDEG
jgi:trimethylamine:corrinoid methyltransferase-like protein